MLTLLLLALLSVAAATQPPGDSVCNPPPDYCLACPQAMELIVYRTHHAGWVYVDIDQEYLNVTYDVSDTAPDCDWKLVDMQLWVSTDFDTVPTTAFGVPLPGQYPRKKEVNCVTEKYTFTFKLVDIFGAELSGSPRIACDDIIWLSAHANLICTNASDATIECAPAWGNGTHFIPQPAEDWGMYNYVQVLCDDDCEPVDDRTLCASSFAMIPDNCYGADSLCFSTLGEDSMMWGWYTEIEKYGHYTFDMQMGADNLKCPPDLGSTVGQVYVDYHKGQKFLVRIVADDGFYIEEVEVYLSKDKPTATFPGKYPGHQNPAFEHEDLHTRIDEFSLTLPSSRGVPTKSKQCHPTVVRGTAEASPKTVIVCESESESESESAVIPNPDEEGGLYFIIHAIICAGHTIEELPLPDKGAPDR